MLKNYCKLKIALQITRGWVYCQTASNPPSILPCPQAAAHHPSFGSLTEECIIQITQSIYWTVLVSGSHYSTLTLAGAFLFSPFLHRDVLQPIRGQRTETSGLSPFALDSLSQAQALQNLPSMCLLGWQVLRWCFWDNHQYLTDLDSYKPITFVLKQTKILQCQLITKRKCNKGLGWGCNLIQMQSWSSPVIYIHWRPQATFIVMKVTMDPSTRI